MLPSIRQAQPADIAAITGIYAHAVRYGTASFELDPPDEAEMRRRYEALRASGHPYLVAELDDAIVGYAYVGPYRARPAYRFAVENPDTLRWMPCTCGCGSLGHASNRACYIKAESQDRVTFTSHAAT